MTHPHLRYVVLCLVFGAGMVVQTWGQQWSADAWAHRAAVLELSHDPWSPAHPFTGSEEADPGLSPYTLLLGLAVRLSPLDVSAAFQVAALLNLVLLLIGLRRFVAQFSDAPMAPFWTLLATLFLWGAAPWRWSGYLNANSIGFGLPYPSIFATALLLFALSALIEFCDSGRRRQLAASVSLAALVVLIHPFTGAALAVGALAVAISRFGAMPARRIAVLAGASVVASAGVLAWPLYRLVDLLGASRQYDEVHALLYHLVGQRTVLALVAIPVLAARFRADHRDPLVLMAASATVIFVLGGYTERYGLGRIMPLGMLALHVALGVWLAERAPVFWRQATRPRRLVSALGGGAVLVAGVFGCAAGLARAVPRPLLPSSIAGDPRIQADDAGLSFLGRLTSPDDVAFVVTVEAARITPALGTKVVAPGYVAPFLEDVDRRRADVARFFASQSAPERRALMHRYGVSFILFDLRFVKADGRLGAVAHRDNRYVLVAVKHPR